ncbi:hypothetical protein BSKO_12055 [Bryopsis sp. KO-2023]|nr:hypothetical protein BSKO_12055 [Bryopsis sp. KO-2023]
MEGTKPKATNLEGGGTLSVSSVENGVDAPVRETVETTEISSQSQDIDVNAELADKLGSLALSEGGLTPSHPPNAEVVTLQEKDILAVSSKTLDEDAKEMVSPPAAPSWGDSRVGVVYDSAMELHEDPAGHVECPGRIKRPFQRLEETGLLERCCTIPSRPAETAELLLAHPQSHIDAVEAERDVEGVSYIEFGDIYFNESTASCARLSAGCCISSAQAVSKGDVQRALALIRPPGHHAECNRAMGFCFYNNVALAALRLLQTSSSVSRVLILDWDVHHGNGLQNMFYEDARVMYISLHRGRGFYPQTGNVSEIGGGEGVGYNVNVPFPKGGFGDADYMAVFSTLVEPLCEIFDPDIVLVSAGFDAIDGDPLGGMRVSPECYGHLTQKMLKFAGGRVVLALEGGYNLEMMADAVQNCVRVLLGEAPAKLDPTKKLKPETEGLIFRVARQLAKKWPQMESDAVEQRWESFMEDFEGGLVMGGRDL